MFPKKWVKHEWGECVYYRSILRRYCWNGFAVDILRQVNLCMLQSGYYRLRSILLPGLADDRRIRWHRDLHKSGKYNRRYIRTFFHLFCVDFKYPLIGSENDFLLTG